MELRWKGDVDSKRQPCDKGLAALRARWLPHYEARHGKLSRALRQKVLTISAAQIDRLLRPRKVRGKGRCGTRPGGLLAMTLRWPPGRMS
jgi:hypothetical protein